MSFEGNKKDFENALSGMQDTMNLLDHCVDDELMKTLQSVVDEYESHYSHDIQDLVDRHEELEDKLADLG